MESAIRQMTSVVGDVRKIARLLQKKAPPGHMLAYINQEEADLLKARGGSGKPHEDTGVPSFQTDDDILFSDVGLAPAPPTPPQEQGPSTELKSFSVAPMDVSAPAQPVNMNAVRDTANPLFPESQQYLRNQGGTSSSSVEMPISDQYAQYGAGRQAAESAAALGRIGAPKPDQDLLGKTQDYFSNLSPETKKILGQTAAGSIPALIGAYQTQQAAEQARKAKEEMMARSAPYKAQADEMITKARSGELTPVGQQQLQAVQAQAAQGAQARGGVGAQQAQAQVEAYRQQLLQGQYDYGLKLANISDQIALGAIKTGLEADRYINAATMDYFNNAIRMFQGQSPQVAGRQPTDTTTSRA